MNVTQFRNICFASFFGCSNRKNRTHRTHHRFTFTQTTESFPSKIACKTIIITIKLVYFKYFLCTFVAFDSIAFPAFVVASNAVWVVVFMCCSRFTQSFPIRSENFSRTIQFRACVSVVCSTFCVMYWFSCQFKFTHLHIFTIHDR